MQLIVITTENFFDKEPEAVNLLFRNGMKALHVRKPCVSYAATKRFIEQIDPAFHSRTVLHDYYELAGLFALKGIHLNRRNSPVNSDLYRKKGLSVSCSCHSIAEVAAADFDYAFLSPVFDSISKAGYRQGFTPEQLNSARDRGVINERVIALGGITAEKIPDVRRYGFGGVAVLGALWGTFAADGNTEGLLARFRTVNSPVINDL